MPWGAIAARVRAVFGVDLRALAALRVGLAALVLVDLALRAEDLRAFYTDEGVLPRHAALAGSPPGALSLGFLHGGVALCAACFAAHALAASAMLAGARTRIATIATWALTVSLHARNPLVEQGADDVIRALLFWSMFLPLGARFSVDAQRRGTPDPASGRLLSIATVAMLVQVAAVYLCTYLHKTGPEWQDGSAVWWALSHDHFGRPWAQRALLPHPDLLRALTRAVLVVEITGPLLLLSPVLTRPARLAGLALLLALQIGFGATLNVAHFPWVSAIALLPFVPTEVWDAIERRARAPDPETARAQGAQGKEENLRALASLAPLRSSSSGFVAAIALAYVLAWSAASVWRVDDAPLGRASAVGVALGLDAQWTMFAPSPARDSGWFVMPGVLANGDEVDLFPAIGRFDEAGPVTWVKPTEVFRAFPSTRWLDYLMMLPEKDDAALWAGVSGWICRAWNAAHGGPRRLLRLTITYMLEEVRAPGAPRPREPHVYAVHACEGALTPATAPAP